MKILWPTTLLSLSGLSLISLKCQRLPKKLFLKRKSPWCLPKSQKPHLPKVPVTGLRLLKTKLFYSRKHFVLVLPCVLNVLTNLFQVPEAPKEAAPEKKVPVAPKKKPEAPPVKGICS